MKTSNMDMYLTTALLQETVHHRPATLAVHGEFTLRSYCEYSNQVVKDGFHDWNKPEAHDTVYYAEYNGHGPGYCPDKRASFVHILTDEEAAMYKKEYILK